jgi:hypothetical protein
MEDPHPRIRHASWLIGPLATLGAVLALLLVARCYEHRPLRLPECGFRNVAGIPCVGCGGTRSMRALSRGKIVEAARFNPGVVTGVMFSFGWVALGCARYQLGISPPSISEQNRRLRRNSLVVGGLLLLNWIYLLLYLP